MTAEQLCFFAILLGAVVLLVTERLRNDLVAVLIVLALAASGVLEPAQALSGLSSEPAVVVVAIFVLSEALHRTGVSEVLGGWIGRLAGGGYTRAVGVIMGAVALLSAFTHHLTTTAVLLPVTLALARARDLPPSKLLMPLSFAASLGTTITIIGAPAFLIASATLQQAGRPGLGIFSIAPIGLALAAAGTLFMMTIGRHLLPVRKGAEDATTRFRLDRYFTEVRIGADSPLVGRTIAEVQDDPQYDFEVIGRLRNGRRIQHRGRQAPPLETGDVLVVATTPEQMVAVEKERGLELHPVAQYGTQGDGGQPDEELSERLAQAVVSPRSDLIGRTLSTVDFRRLYGAIVLGLWRRDGWIEEEIAHVRLRAGDVLVVYGDDAALERVATDGRFLMVVPFHGEARPRRKAPLAAAIVVATILGATLGLPLEMVALAGAAAMVLTGCLTVRQAYAAVDPRIYVFIAGAIPLGTAMSETGASELLAGWFQTIVGGWSPTLVLGALFAVVAVVTQFMSDSATTALVGPVAVALAGALGQSPEAFVVTVAMASVASFLTPIGHHGNLLVYGPGGYRFRDFVRAGTPLTVLVGVIVVLLAPLLWPAR
ncbi:MAG TPA: SLC13 family permease [Candidatus Tectomicrobia bacterium]|nr:SLC13 family permease [Candidatus Tectomicrobia bacterium]